MVGGVLKFIVHAGSIYQMGLNHVHHDRIMGTSFQHLIFKPEPWAATPAGKFDRAAYRLRARILSTDRLRVGVSQLWPQGRLSPQ